ncbi:MAG: GNAT family N-acetyltransferase [Candidatus Hermodarchaeota archaeon]
MGIDLCLREPQGSSDFNIIATIRNEAVKHHQGIKTSCIDGKVIANHFSGIGRIVEIEGIPIGYIFVMKDRTQKGKIWEFTGPICLPKYENKGVEKILLDWLMSYGREKGISTLVRPTRASSSHDFLRKLLEDHGFYTEKKMYTMKLELTEPPSPLESLPDGLELVNYRGKEDFTTLWSVLEEAFNYGENKDIKYKELRHFFGSEAIKSAYIPICIQRSSQQPIATIAAGIVKTDKGKIGQIWTYGVISSYQGKGIGSLLMKRSIDFYWRSNITTIELGVKADNHKAFEIYKHFGFQFIPNRTIITLKKKL